MIKSLTLTWRPFARIIFLQLIFILVLVTGFGLGTRFYVKKQYLKTVTQSMQDLLSSLEHQLPELAEINDEWCLKVAKNTQFRLSIISSTDGHFYCDTAYVSAHRPPILHQPEIQDVMKNQHFGSAIRYSPTMKDDAFYGTQLLPERELILRTGIKLSVLNQTIHSFDRGLLIFMILLAVFLIMVIFLSGKKLLFPLASLAVEETSQNLRQDFVANVSHELKTPLTSIKGFADTLVDDLEHERKVEKEFVQIISQESARLLDMVNDLLDLSAIDQGALMIEKEIIDTKKITDECLRRLHIVYGSKKQKISVGQESLEVFADPDRLTQIMLNLIGNAMKYSPEGAHIELNWKMNREHTTLEIKDNGPGLSTEDQAHLFERFFRGGQKQTGHGLGLSIVKHLVHLHQGHIEVQSKEGEGTQFNLTFPLPTPKN